MHSMHTIHHVKPQILCGLTWSFAVANRGNRIVTRERGSA